MKRFSLKIRDRHGFERTVPLHRGITLGRLSQCDVVLSDPMISRTHLKLEIIAGKWYAQDLNSSHGSFMNEQKVDRVEWPIGTPLILADGAYHLCLEQKDQLISDVNLRAILETAQLLAHEMDLDDLLEQAMDRLLNISGTDRGFIMLLEDNELVTKVRRKLGRELEGEIQVSLSSVRSVYDTGEPIWILNVSDDEKLQAQHSIMMLQLQTILCLPLTVQGRRIGVVYLDSKHIVTDPVDRPTFEAIVTLIAIALERTRLTETNLRGQVLATVGQVTSSIVHDFKNGLFVIRGHAELMEALSSDLKMRQHGQKILETVDRLGRMTQDVLDYAKVREPEREPLQLKSYLEGVVDSLKPRAKDFGIQLETSGEDLKISLDAHRFTRVMENLVANSIDALAEYPGGTPATAKVRTSWKPCPGGVRISVTDNGKGIPKKVLKRIFEPFYSFGKKKGTGLGMPTVRKIVEEHGGTLEVISEEGQGTEVVIFLPEHQPPRTEGIDTTGFHRNILEIESK